MATICFDIKRVDDNYVCIQHCNTNVFEYNYHLPLSFYPRERNGKNCWWLKDKYYRYVWIVVEKDKSGIERIAWACNDKVWLNKSIKQFFSDKEIRVIKLPFEHVLFTRQMSDGTKIPIYETTDLGGTFKIWCPIDLNEKYHIYADGYEEVEPTVTYADGFEFRERNFKWIPPKMLGE